MIRYFSAETGFSKRSILIIFISGLLIHLIAAWNSIGFFHFDEHYQILEFAAYKAGLTNAEDLAWEHKAQIRPTLQPWIAYFTIKLHALFRPHDSFTVAGILRVITTFLGFATSLLLTAAAFKWIRSELNRKILLLLSVFLWFIVFMDARFSSESWAGIFFFSALALLVLKDSFYKNEDNQNPAFLIFCGFLIGLSLVFRLQMVLLLPGFGLWCIFIARTPVKTLIYMVSGGILALAFGFLCDYFFYGNFVNTAYRYFEINILEGKAAEFGVSPWYYYIPEFIDKAHLPLSFVILILTAISWITYPKHILTFTCVPFILLHMLISHKELRFLFPIAHAMPVFLALAFQFITQKFENTTFRKNAKLISYVLLAIIFIQNTIILSRTITAPASQVLGPVSFLYREAKKQDVNIILADQYEFGFLQGLPMNFYVTPQMHVRWLSTSDSIKTFLRSSNRPVYFLLSNRGLSIPEKFKPLQENITKTTYAIPGWYQYININNWLNRTTFWRMYKLEAKPGE